MAQHFKSTGRSISDVQVRGVALCSGTNIQQKQPEMRLICQLQCRHRSAERTENQYQFYLNWAIIYILRALSHARALGSFLSIVLRSTVQRFSSHRRRVIHPQRLCFSLKHLTLFDISSPNITSLAI